MQSVESSIFESSRGGKDLEFGQDSDGLHRRGELVLIFSKHDGVLCFDDLMARKLAGPESTSCSVQLALVGRFPRAFPIKRTTAVFLPRLRTMLRIQCGCLEALGRLQVCFFSTKMNSNSRCSPTFP